MSTNSNLYSQGGGGTLFEFETHAALFITLLIGGYIPGSEEEKIIQYRQQAGSLGYSTDDLYLLTKDKLGYDHRLLVQIKHGLVISKTDETWAKVLTDAWKDFTNPALFDKTKDKLLVIKDDLTQKEKKHLKELSNWAKSKTSEADFTNEMSRIKAKQEYYDLFKGVLQNNGFNPTAAEMHEFFRCFDIWEYDFGNFTSVNRSNFLNLIELAKAPGSRLSAAEIWDKIQTFVSSADSKGGMFEWEKLPADLVALFNPSYFPLIQKQLLTLTEESKEIVDLIKDSIGTFVLDRNDLMEEARQELENNQIFIISGEPGSGKSAIAKRLLIEHTGTLIALKADELAEGNLIDIIKAKGINLTITEFFNHFPLNTRHIIYIDALEKLLEGEGKAFQQLLKVLKKHPDIKVVASCRNANFHLLEIKYFAEQVFFKQNIGFLSDQELTQVVEKLPELKLLIENKRLSALIKVPKYLDFAQRAIKISGKTFSEANEAEFIQDLWDIIVENKLDAFAGGLAQKRKEAFIQIAVERAKQMAPFVPAKQCDPEALEQLEKDNVVIRSRQNLYTPGHDVLEDWALIRYVDSSFHQHSEAVTFFKSLGTEPAMRRAYRLWVQNALSEQDKNKIAFFSANLSNSLIDRFWQDESLIALLHSNYCEIFFQENEASLTANNWALFLRIVHILRTACRENSRSTWAERYYVPIGAGWHMVIRYFERHKDKLPASAYDLMLQTLEDYSRLLYITTTNLLAIREAGLTTLFLLEYFKSKARFYYDDKIVERCIKLIFEFSSGIKEEIDQLFKISVEMDDKDDRGGDWIETRYYQKIITLALDGVTSGQLSKEYPDLLIKLARKRWFYTPKTFSASGGDFHSFGSRSMEEEINLEFGLNEEERFLSTPSALRTFILLLLRYHPEKALDFITEFTNKVTDAFLANKGINDNTNTFFAIELPDGSTKVIRGIPQFWVSYRGYSGGVPKLIESVLMALERFMIELGNKGDQVLQKFRSNLQKLYTQSHSLFVAGVLASICQAHPSLAGEWSLPLFSNREFFYFDLNRYTRDLVTGSFGGPDDEYYKERGDADRMKHRLTYHPGLKGFITHPILYSEGHGERIFGLIDKHRAKVKKEDLDWRRYLDDIDWRTYKIKEIIKEEDGKEMAVFQPEYETEVAEKLEEDKKNVPFEPQDMTDSLWMSKILDGTEKINFDRWRQIYQRYSGLSEYIWHEHAPGLLAAIAVRDIWNEISDEEKHWCAASLFSAMQEVQKRKTDDFKISAFDQKAVHIAFPLLLFKEDTGIDNKIIYRLFFDLLVTNFFDDPNYRNFINAAGGYIWKTDGAFAARFWKGLINFASISTEDVSDYDDEEADDIADHEKLDQLFDTIQDGELPINIENITATSHDQKILAKAIRILPSKDTTTEGVDFLIKMMDLYQQYEEGKDRFSRRQENSGMELDIKFALQEKIPAVIFNNLNERGIKLFDNVLERVTATDFIDKMLSSNGNLLAFFNAILDNIIVLVEHSRYLEEPAKREAFSAFHSLWQHFDEFLTQKKSFIFSEFLLLDTLWNEVTRHWEPIEEMIPFLEQMIEKYGLYNIGAVVNLLTHPANKLLMPKGISILVNLIRKSSGTKSIVSYKFSEKLIYRAYEHCLDQIKADKQILSDYLWLLDQLVLQGSSDAYWIREFLISFSTPA